MISAAQSASVNSSDAGRNWKQLEVIPVQAAHKPDAVNEYGGSKEHTLESTGFFYVTKQSNQWWLVDPAGHLFYMKGVNSVQAKRIGKPDSKAWAKETHTLLTETGFNTLGRWSDAETFLTTGVPIAWCNTISFMKDYSKQRSVEFGERGFPKETLPVFDDEWPKFCESYAEQKASHLKNDKWLIGHFSDNELPFRPDALSKYLSLPKNDAGYKGAVQWMRDNQIKQSRVKEKQVQKEFLEVVSRRYFGTVAVALKKADPNHLYIGSRLHGRCISEPVLRSSAVCDLISINYYHRWEPKVEQTEDWMEWAGRPFFVSEFYAMKVTDQKTKADGAGFRVLSHEDAVSFYHTYTAGLLKDIPGCVGWHWFKYADDSPEWQKGIVGSNGEVHQSLVDGMKIINDQVYSLRGLH
jgi:hypothetical protein